MKQDSQSGVVVENLAQRHQVEQAFHDIKAHYVAPKARTDFYPEWLHEEHTQMLLTAAGPLAGKRVLDFGCGLGQTSRIYAAHGAARVEGFDISGESIRIARQNAERDGMSDRVFFRRCAAEEIDYPDNSFDVIIGKAILHHTDLEKTSWQLNRVLSPGGVSCFLEPLAHNPFLNLFRRLTPWRRTPTEKPLSLKDLDYFRKYFQVTYRGAYLFTIAANGMLFVTGSRKLFKVSSAMLRATEKPVLTVLPFLQRYCWSALLVFRKPE